MAEGSQNDNSTPPPRRPARIIRKKRKNDPEKTVREQKEVVQPRATSQPTEATGTATTTNQTPPPLQPPGTEQIIKSPRTPFNGPGPGGTGEGGDTEWSKSLMDSVTQIPGAFDKELQAKLLAVEDSKRQSPFDTAATKLPAKMAGIGAPTTSTVNMKLSANARLVKWLESRGRCAGRGQPPHPMTIST